METNLSSAAQMVQLSWQEKITTTEPPSILGAHPIKEKSTTVFFMEKRTELIQQNNNNGMSLRLEKTFGAYLEILFYCHHVQPRVKLNMPQQRPCPVPLTYFGCVAGQLDE